jgi:hypothetical protein
MHRMIGSPSSASGLPVHPEDAPPPFSKLGKRELRTSQFVVACRA